jgi:hypothetical protein
MEACLLKYTQDACHMESTLFNYHLWTEKQVKSSCVNITWSYVPLFHSKPDYPKLE